MPFDPVGALVMVLLLISNVMALQAVIAEQFFNFRYAIRSSMVLVFMAIPVMIAGYLFFPRLPPLWHIPNEQRGGVTGMSDELSFGSVSDLAQSNAPAFRVQFDGALPPRQQWYWRGMTLSEFDGRTWSVPYGRAFSRRNIALPQPAENTTSYLYTVVSEKTGRRWLYFLDWPVSIVADDSVVLPDARAATQSRLNNIYRYNAQSASQVIWSEQSTILQLNRQLPRTGNMALRDWALDQRSLLSSDAKFADWLMQYISSEPFYYTLRPPLYLSEDNIESFWFGDRRGFCEHYASAMAFILRSVGIPARIVGGYLGGTYVASNNYIQVRQMEAHAWVEAWIDGRWQRYDPTAAVAPGRIESNLDDLLTRTQPSELPLATRVGRIGILNRMSLLWDSIEYRWQVTVLDYTNDSAIGWFESVFGKVSSYKLALGVLSILALVALITALMLGMITLPKRLPEPYRSLRQIEKRYGIRQTGETLSQYFARLSRQYPEVTHFDQLCQLIEQQVYTGQPVDKEQFRKTVRLLKSVHVATMKLR
ncbi:MAG: DUF3488 and transglutaminase-like domain-containing protein [Reinekea sp.]